MIFCRFSCFIEKKRVSLSRSFMQTQAGQEESKMTSGNALNRTPYEEVKI